MSLMIDVDRIKEILLPDGKWYKVNHIYIDAYELITHHPDDPNDITIEFQSENKDNYVGFTASLSNDSIDIAVSGPMSSILAIKQKR